MSLFSKLFGGGKSAKPAAEPEEHDGFTIYPEPAGQDGQFRIGARIEKTVGGELKTHRFIRADTVADLETANSISVTKAKMLIDQQGDRIFD